MQEGWKQTEKCWMFLHSKKRGAVPKVWGSLNYFKFTSEFKSAKI